MISYKKLWKVLIDKDLKKKDLITVAGISSYTVNKLTHGDNVTTDILQRICKTLGCDIGDIMEVLPDEVEANQKDKGNVTRYDFSEPQEELKVAEKPGKYKA